MLSLHKTQYKAFLESSSAAKRDYVQAGCEARRKYLSAWPLGGLLCSGGT